MIKFTLKCAEGHSFESWFQSGSAFDAVQAAGHVTCPVCGTSQVDKAPMAPKLAQNVSAPSDEIAVQSTPVPEEVASALKRMKDAVETHSDYVGESFASEARAIHLDEAPARPIHGEAKAEEAQALLDDGIPVLPLPFRPSRKNN
ncbi:MAG: DUF1178 family protein [Pseudomonadota bacterium]